MDTVQNNKDWNYYIKGFSEALARQTPCREVIAEYFSKNQTRFRFDQMSHVLSVGPNEGNFDMCMLNHFTSCRYYSAVEPNPNAVIALECNLKERHPSIQFKLTNKRVEDWDGPDDKVDLIIVSYVMQYVEKRPVTIRAMLSWLKPDGYLLFIHSRQDIFAKTRSMLKSYKLQEMAYMYDALRTDLESVEHLEILSEDIYNFQLDLRNPSLDLVYFTYEKICNDKEVEEAYQCFKAVAPTGIDNKVATGVLMCKNGLQI